MQRRVWGWSLALAMGLGGCAGGLGGRGGPEAWLAWVPGLGGPKARTPQVFASLPPEFLGQAPPPPDPPKPADPAAPWPWPAWAQASAAAVGQRLPERALALPAASFGPGRSTQLGSGAEVGLPFGPGVQQVEENAGTWGQLAMLPLAPLPPGHLTGLCWLAHWAGEFQSLSWGVIRRPALLAHLGLQALPTIRPRTTSRGTVYQDDPASYARPGLGGGPVRPWDTPYVDGPGHLGIDLLPEDGATPTVDQFVSFHRRNAGDLSAPLWAVDWARSLEAGQGLEGQEARRGQGRDARLRTFRHAASGPGRLSFAWHAPAEGELPEVLLVSQLSMRGGRLREEVQGLVGGMPVAWVQENLERGEGYWQAPGGPIPLALVREDLIFRTPVFRPGGPQSLEHGVGFFGDNPTPTPVLPEAEPSPTPLPPSPSPSPTPWVNEGK